jgi:hypothetical protein
MRAKVQRDPIEDLELYKKQLNIVQYTISKLRLFPKAERDYLSREIMRATIENSRIINKIAEYDNSNQRLKLLTELHANLRLVNSLVRIAYNYRYLTPKVMQIWAGKNFDISNMAKAWKDKIKKGQDEDYQKSV